MVKNYKILIAPDSFKASLSATEVAKILANRLQKSNLPIQLTSIPLADGGEGSLEAIKQSRLFESVRLKVYNPLFKEVEAYYLFDNNENTAYVELAQASGFHLVNELPDIMNSSTFGTGQLIKHAIAQGAEKIILFIGGSATNDAGLGILEALGFRFFDAKEKQLKPLPVNLVKINKIDDSNSVLKTNEKEIIIAADVTNPFYGEHGAAYVYAPQKGANPEQVKHLDAALEHLSKLIHTKYSVDLQKIKGAGAAGGVGGGLFALAGASIVSGSELIFSLLNLENKIKEADLIISGEGKVDIQSLNSKLLCHISKLVRKSNKKLWVVCGYFEGDEQLKRRLNIEHVYSLAKNVDEINETIINAVDKLEKVAKLISQRLANTF